MKLIDYTHNISDDLILPDFFSKYYPDSKLLFFDIETTGLSARNSTLYLIGALWYDENSIRIRQWFNDDGYSEKEILESFDTFCRPYSNLVHFNGTTFDVPYINEKAGKNGLTDPSWTKLIGIDIYKEIRSYKSILYLENMKQVSIEKFLGINREDIYNGKELINIYQRYAARPDEEKENLLLLHNHDDLLGMPLISHILNYKVFFEDTDIDVNTIKHTSDNKKLKLEFNVLRSCSLPKRIVKTDKNGIFVNALGQNIIMEIPIYSRELKHFFEDYRNYYYLPIEDTAIHKSIASYVENKNRIRAVKDNCYVRKTDDFILCPDQTYPELFKETSKDKNSYCTLNSFINLDKEKQGRFIKMYLHNIIKN